MLGRDIKHPVPVKFHEYVPSLTTWGKLYSNKGKIFPHLLRSGECPVHPVSTGVGKRKVNVDGEHDIKGSREILP